MAKNDVFMPPETKIMILKDFDLSKIEETFAYADFERRISKNRVHKMAHAILDNKFVDKYIHVVPSEKKDIKYTVLEGQHRIEGLRYARDYSSLATYDLVLIMYLNGDPREIYRRLNLGTPLTLEAHLRAIDNGGHKFFNDLRDYCDHHPKGTKLSFVQVINCLHYAKSTSIRPVRPLTVDDFIIGITTNDIRVVKNFISILLQIATNPDDIFYHYTIMRNFFRIYYENSISEDSMIELGKQIRQSKKIQELSEKRDTHAMRGIYHYIIDILSPKVNLHLEKGLVKDKE